MELGVEPYPYSFKVSQTIDELQKDAASLIDVDTEVSVYGRVTGFRR